MSSVSTPGRSVCVSAISIVLYGMLKIEPRLGVVLPCRITIMEREGGEVILVVPNLRVISRWFNNDELVGLWDRMEETFTNIIDEVPRYEDRDAEDVPVGRGSFDRARQCCDNMIMARVPLRAEIVLSM